MSKKMRMQWNEPNIYEIILIVEKLRAKRLRYAAYATCSSPASSRLPAKNQIHKARGAHALCVTFLRIGGKLSSNSDKGLPYFYSHHHSMQIWPDTKKMRELLFVWRTTNYILMSKKTDVWNFLGEMCTMVLLTSKLQLAHTQEFSSSILEQQK